MRQSYPTFIAKADNDFLVYVPDLEIYTEGKNVTDAIYMARDAIGLKGIALEDEKREIPIPSDYENAMRKAQEDADEFDFSKGILTMVDVDFAEYRRKVDSKTVRRNVTLPNWLNVAAEEAGVNVSKVLQEALIEKVGMKRNLR